MKRRTWIWKFPANAKSTVFLVTAGTVAFAFHSNSNLVQFSGDSWFNSGSPEKIRAASNAVLRSCRALHTFAFVVVDYKYSLRGLAWDSDEYLRKLSEVHLRSAKRILELCECNKGFYVKAGQFISSLRHVPKEYSSTLSSLQDQAVPHDFKAIKELLVNNLGKDLPDVFLSFDEQPIAAASIAQVHHARLKDNQEVAVKVQYPGLEHQMKTDIMIMDILSRCIAQVFHEYRFDWIVSEFEKTVSLELDFIQEAKNSERTARNFERNNLVEVPRVFWDLTRKQVLTMQFCKGNKVDDLEFLKEFGINPTKVAQTLMEVFAEMIFVHGFVHGDPHPGNILVSPKGRKGFSLVLLDHGVYKELDDAFRSDYCELWKALILLDSHKIQHLGEKLGAGKYSRYFSVIFTGRTIDSKSALGGGMSKEERRKLKQELTALNMGDISKFMESLSPDFLPILRIDGLLRSIVSKLCVSQRVRLLAYAKFAMHGLGTKHNNESGFTVWNVVSRFRSGMGYVYLRIILGVLGLHSQIEAFRNLLVKKLKIMLFEFAQFLREIS